MMRWWCRRRGYHKWLMGGPAGEFIPTPDICLTCRERTSWEPYGSTQSDGSEGGAV